jgi:hypothetical protein
MSDLRIRTIDEGNLETVIAEDVHFEGERPSQTQSSSRVR